MKNVLVICGHTDPNSLCNALANAYVEGATAAGANVRLLNLGELTFDPVLRLGYTQSQTLEPDLVKAQDWLSWAEHTVWVYPNWWGSMPAILKGFFDRVFLPGFAFKYRKGSSQWDRLLQGRSAHLMVTMDSPSWYYRWVNGRPGHVQMKRTILEFCGIKVKKLSEFAPVRGSGDTQRAQWVSNAQKLGAKLA